MAFSTHLGKLNITTGNYKAVLSFVNCESHWVNGKPDLAYIKTTVNVRQDRKTLLVLVWGKPLHLLCLVIG